MYDVLCTVTSGVSDAICAETRSGATFSRRLRTDAVISMVFTAVNGEGRGRGYRSETL